MSQELCPFCREQRKRAVSGGKSSTRRSPWKFATQPNLRQTKLKEEEGCKERCSSRGMEAPGMTRRPDLETRERDELV